MSSLNILERVILKRIDGVRPGVRGIPRLLVRRRSLTLTEIESRFLCSTDQTDLSGGDRREVFGDRDWTPCFRLDPKANHPDRNVIELDFAFYCAQCRDTRRRTVFSFSSPARADDGRMIMYGVENRGPLAAEGFLCQWSGAFETLESFDIVPIWQS